MQDTLDHIRKVQRLLAEVCFYLSLRSIEHDKSKFDEPEKSGFKAMSRLKDFSYGSPEYYAQLKANQETINHHYAHNRHHPEFHEDGVRGMSLIDLIEMLCDWKAASERHGGDIRGSVAHNVQRFGISEQLAAILLNTCDTMMWPDKTVFLETGEHSDPRGPRGDEGPPGDNQSSLCSQLKQHENASKIKAFRTSVTGRITSDDLA